ncbi:MAG: hypothetical protein VX589_18200 [Myxococcota bacterium]|nr:hypothetical protein [Myxococcota bacterium]
MSHLVDILRLRKPEAIGEMWRYAGYQANPGGGVNTFDLATWLAALLGERTAEEVAVGLDLKASVLRRILRGDADPPFARVLMLVQALTGRIVDFVELLVDPGEIRSLRAPWRSVKAQRKTAREQLNAQAIMAALETDAYLALDQHSNDWLAETLSLATREVEDTVEALRIGGAIKMRRGRYLVERNRYVSTARDVEVTRRLGRHWAERALNLPNDQCPRGHLVFSCSPAALEKIFESYNRAHHDAVAAFQHGHGQSPTRVVCISTQFAFLDGKSKP